MVIDTTSYPSPNYNERDLPITILVIHATAGLMPQTAQHLCNPAPINPRTHQPDPSLAVSTHYIVDKKGKIFQLVPDAKRAWHAGVSYWDGITDVNSASIGVELENMNDGVDPYPQVQVDALSVLVAGKLTHYSIKLSNLVRHLDIAPKRKTDPKGFPWETWKAQFSAVETKPDRWSLWGVQFPLYQNARVFGIPQKWYSVGIAERMGEARSNEMYCDGFSYIAFQRGIIVYNKTGAHVIDAPTLK